MNTLEESLSGDFSPVDQGYPQTARTQRVRNILEMAIALSGAEIEAYNFHERPGCVFFNVRYGGGWVTASTESFKCLEALTDAALIQQWIPRTLEYGCDNGEIQKTEE